MSLMRLIACSALALACGLTSAHAAPLTVQNCGRTLAFDKVPSRAVSHDQNISEMMFALGLQDRMVAISGITGWYKMTPGFKAQMGALPEIAPKEPSLETLVAVNPDFFFAGWYYGMKPGGDVTPDTLKPYGVTTYVLTESCVHLDRQRPRASFNMLFEDITNLGAIFDRKQAADGLISGWTKRLDAIRSQVGSRPAPRVFVYDSGEDKPFTAGKFAMPTAIIEAAGGRNIMDDVETSWGKVNWEAVAARNPEFILLLDYQDEAGWRKLWSFLEGFPPMAATDAVKNRRFLPLGYTELTPGPANIGATEKLARALHPGSF